MEERPDVAKKLGKCRRERLEVNEFFPKSAKLDHSSFAAKNLCANLPNELKCAKKHQQLGSPCRWLREESSKYIESN